MDRVVTVWRRIAKAGAWLVGAAVLAGVGMGFAGQPAEAGLLLVGPATGETLPGDAADKAKGIGNVTKVEPYLVVRTKPHDVIGVPIGAPLRIVTRDGKLIEARLEAGKEFRKQDEGKPVALVGKVYSEDYLPPMAGMREMKHYFSLGQSFVLVQGAPRFRVIGGFGADPEAEAARVFVPLSTAQKVFGREGKVSHLVVTVQGDAEAAAKEVQAALGSAVKVAVVAR